MIELFFTAHNGNPIAPAGQLGVLPGDKVSVDAVITTGELGTRGFDIFLDYDGGASGHLVLDTAANVLPPEPVPGVPWVTQINPGTEQPGRVRFSSILAIPTISLPGGVLEGLKNSTFTFGQATLTVTDAIFGGPATLFPDADFIVGVMYSDGNVGSEFEEVEITANFSGGGLTLLLIPEPSTGLLLSAGLIPLASRRLPIDR